MREFGAVKHKLKQVRFRHLKRLIEDGLSLTPKNCAHNRMFHHPNVTAHGGPPVGICVCPAQEGDVLCDVAWGGEERARMCPLFESAGNKDSIKQEFNEFLATADLAVIAKEYPDLAALMWVLQEEIPNREIDLGESDFEVVASQTVAPVFVSVTYRDHTYEFATIDQAEQFKQAMREAEGALTQAAHLRTEAVVLRADRLRTPVPVLPVQVASPTSDAPRWKVWLRRWLA